MIFHFSLYLSALACVVSFQRRVLPFGNTYITNLLYIKSIKLIATCILESKLTSAVVSDYNNYRMITAAMDSINNLNEAKRVLPCVVQSKLR